MVSFFQELLKILVCFCNPVKPFFRSIIKIEPVRPLVYSLVFDQGKGIVRPDMFEVKRRTGRKSMRLKASKYL
jgi:hypothetical protein